MSKHPTEELVISRVETYQEEEGEEPQIVGSIFRERRLPIAPKSFAALPFSFLPQIPSHRHGEEDDILGMRSSSKESVLDLASVLNIDPLNIGKDQSHHIRTKLRLYTSKGVHEAELHASTRNTNLHRIPHTIIFEKDGFVHTDTAFTDSDRQDYHYLMSQHEKYYSSESAQVSSLQKSSNNNEDEDVNTANVQDIVGYEYDIYIDSPCDRCVLDVMDIYPSKPNLVSLKQWHSRALTQKGSDQYKVPQENNQDHQYRFDRFNNCGFSRLESMHCNNPKTMEVIGPLSINGNGKRIYIGTIRLNKEQLQKDGVLYGIDELSLGYMHVYLESDSKPILYSIALEYSSNDHINHAGTVANSSLQKREKVNQKPSSKLGAIKTAPPPDDEIDNYSPIVQGKFDCDTYPESKPVPFSIGVAPPIMEVESLNLIEVPQKPSSDSNANIFLDFGLLTGESDIHTVYISVTNVNTEPIRLMHHRIVFENEFEAVKGAKNTLDGYGSTLKKDYDESIIIEPGETLFDGVKVSIASKEMLKSNDSISEFHGVVILRFGPASLSFDQWMEKMKGDLSLLTNYVIEIPLVVRTMSGHVEYNANDFFFPLDENSIGISSRPKTCEKLEFDRKLIITNHFSSPLSLSGISIDGTFITGASDELSADLCRSKFEILGYNKKKGKKRSESSVANPGESWGHITLRYKEGHDKYKELDNINIPKQCSLVLYTPEVGQFRIPLWLYKGGIEVSTDISTTPHSCIRELDDGLYSILSGFDCLNAMGKESKLASLLKLSTTSTTGHTKGLSNFDKAIINAVKGFYTSIKNWTKKVQPVIMSFGTLSTSSIKSSSIYISNKNPFAVTMHADIPSIEGMEVRLGKVSIDVDDLLEGTKDRHEVRRSVMSDEWLKKYLLEFDGPSRTLLNSFSYRDDVSIMDNATDVLKNMFKEYASIRLHREPNGLIINEGDSSPTGFPPNFDDDPLVTFSSQNNLRPTPSLVSIDDDTIYSISTSIMNNQTSFSYNIPPGGTVRLEVGIRSPTKKALKNRDFATILMSGLLLSTELGDRIPIFGTYKVLSGELKIGQLSEVSHDSSDDKSMNNLIVDAILRPSNENPFQYGTGNSGMTVRIDNNFAANVTLTKLESCNRWFEFTPTKSESSLPVNISPNGSYSTRLQSYIFCGSTKNRLFPSFYHCALEWIEKKSSVQNGNCGTQYGLIDEMSSMSKTNASVVTEAKTRVAIALKDAINYMDANYGPSKTESASNFESLFFLNKAKSIAAEWRALSQLGLNKIRGTVKAQFTLTQPNGQSLSVQSALPSTFLETSLEFPYLSERNVDFEPTKVGEVSEAFIEVKNPSGYSVSVRMVKDRNSPFYVHKSSVNDPWWTGGIYYLPDQRPGVFMRSMHNVSVHTISGSSLALQSPSLHSTSAFTNACSGRRCGIHFPNDDGSNTNKNKEEQRKVSAIGAASVYGKKLVGHVYNRDGAILHQIMNVTKHHYFAVQKETLNEVIIPPYSSSKIGPFYFRPFFEGTFSGYLVLKNSLTGFEAVKFQGKGSSHKIDFIDNDEKDQKGVDIELRNGKETLVFRHRNSDILGRSSKMVMIANTGETEIEIKSYYLVDPLLSYDIEDKNRKCRLHGYQLGDCDYNGVERNMKTIKLNPNQSKPLFITQHYDCTFRSREAMLIVEYGHPEENSQVDFKELVLHYELNESEAGTCSSSKPSILDLLRANQLSVAKLLFAMLWQLWSILIPFILFSSLLWDMVSSANQRQQAARQFKENITSSPTKKANKSKKTGFKTWSSAYRCLSRADPTSTELIQLGQEQTRQMVLNTFRREELLHPQCVLSNGTFSRERQGSVSSDPNVRRQGVYSNMTLNEVIFSKQRDYRKVMTGDSQPILPSGLGWRILAASRSPRRPSRVYTSQKPPSTNINPKSQSRIEENINEEVLSSTKENSQIPNATVTVRKTSRALFEISKESIGKEKKEFIADVGDNFSKKHDSFNKATCNERQDIPIGQISGDLKDKQVEKGASDSTKQAQTEATIKVENIETKQPPIHSPKLNSERNVNIDQVELGSDEKNSSIDIGNHSSSQVECIEDEVCELIDEGENKSSSSPSVEHLVSTEKEATKEGDTGRSTISSPPGLAIPQSHPSPPPASTKPKKKSNSFTSRHPSETSSIILSEQEIAATLPPPTSAKIGTNGSDHTMDDKLKSKSHIENEEVQKTNTKRKKKKEKKQKQQPDKPCEEHLSVGETDSSSMVTQDNDPREEKEVPAPPHKQQPKKKETKKKKKKKRDTSSLKKSKKVEEDKSEQIPDTNVIVTPASSPKTQEKYSVRPPPGLAPPPGFGDTSFSSPKKDIIVENTQQMETTTLKSSGSGVDLLAQVLDSNSSLTLSPLNEKRQMEDSDIDLSKLLPGIGDQENNVLNYLNFLEDPKEESLGEEQRNGNFGALRLYGGLSSVSNNPWSDSNPTPRAFAYGFDVRSEGDENDVDRGYAEVNPNLLTPSAILGNIDSDDEQEDAADTFDADAFFSDLLE